MPSTMPGSWRACWRIAKTGKLCSSIPTAWPQTVRLPARLLKLRDMASNDYNADTLYVLAVNAEAGHRLAALAASWGAEPHIYSQEDTERALGTSCTDACLIQMWWD